MTAVCERDSSSVVLQVEPVLDCPHPYGNGLCACPDTKSFQGVFGHATWQVAEDLVRRGRSKPWIVDVFRHERLQRGDNRWMARAWSERAFNILMQRCSPWQK
jgi:hypothetical protein